LHHVNFGQNQIKGPIPPEFFSELSTVEVLNLSGNALTGTVPTTITEMELLEELYLNDNPGLNGNLPVAISSMPKLESLDISATQIIGDMEAALCENGKSWETLRTDCLDDGTASSCATECCHQDGHCCDMTGQTACEVPPAP
jgi:Leucine rich repeat